MTAHRLSGLQTGRDSGPVRLVAVREIRQRARGRAFRIATVLLLLGVAAAVVIPAETASKTNPAGAVGVVGPLTPGLRNVVHAAAASTGTSARIVAEPDAHTAETALRAGKLDVVVEPGRLLVATSTSRSDPLPRTLAALLGLARAVHEAGLTPQQAARIAAARPLPVASLEPARASTAGRTTAVFGMIIMFVLLTQYLTWTLIGVMEEKSSRVVEVLLATVRPLQLLTGKVLGIATLVFGQAAALAVLALVLADVVGSDLLHGKAPLVLVSSLVWLVLGYAFYCWLYAAAGSTVERQDQVQTLALPLGLPMVVGYIAGVTVTSSGHAAMWFHVLAYLPPTAPFAMTALVGLGAVAWWQFLLSALLSVASTVAVARLAATVYQRAILRTGQRVPLRDVLPLRAR